MSFSFCRCSEESVMLRIMDRDCSSSDIRKRSKGGGGEGRKSGGGIVLGLRNTTSDFWGTKATQLRSSQEPRDIVRHQKAHITFSTSENNAHGQVNCASDLQVSGPRRRPNAVH